ncbi:NAD(P)/FAD-dependent oxidoreductase [Spiroplasma clarkii]|uniref:NAD(P)/FAD-dependent oxidoreductase n=1 Tax=Spiroplasma clarkii TaxID=2139 RepID=UPI0011BADDC0|nr:NAD(P)/FAD-dependent oxidoreductase [Spiroplasma clarkii]
MTKDLLIIGCGPAGLYAWKMAADLGLTGIIVEGQPSYGGQVSNNYPEKIIKNLPAIPEIKASDAMDNMYAAINQNADIAVKYNTTIKSIDIITPKEDADWQKIDLKLNFQISQLKNLKEFYLLMELEFIHQFV